MKAMEIDSSNWTDEMRQSAAKKLEELGYEECFDDGQKGILSISVFRFGAYVLCDHTEAHILYNEGAETLTTYEELMSLTKEDVQ